MKNIDIEILLLESKIYNSRQDLREKNPKLYREFQKRKQTGLLDEIFPKSKKWSDEHIKEELESRKYQTRKEFENNCKGGYGYLRREKKLDLLDKFFLKRQIMKWSKESVLLTASQYQSRNKFNKENPGAVNFIKKNGLESELDKVLPRDLIKWTEEKAIEVIKNSNCNSRAEFSKNNKKVMAYLNRTSKKHLLDSKFPNKKRDNWDYESLKKEALLYGNKSDFSNKSSGAYAAVCRMGIMDDISKHMTRLKREKPWTEEEVRTEAPRYKTKKDFQKNSKGAYGAAKRLGIYPDITKEYIILGNKSKRCIYVIESKKNRTAYIGLTSDFCRRISDHKMKKQKSSAVIFNYDDVETTKLTKYLPIEKAQEMEGFYINEYIQNGYKVNNDMSQIGALGGGKFDLNKYIELVKSCDSMKELYDKHPSTVIALRRKGILHEHILHFADYIQNKELNKKNHWTNERIIEKAKEYKYGEFTKFNKENHGAYVAAKNNGLMQEIETILGKRQRTAPYTKDELFEIAKKYGKNEFKNFRTENRGAHSVACREGWIEDIRNYFETSSRNRRYWTKDEMMKHADTYSSYKEFREKDKSSATLSNKKGWSGDIKNIFKNKK